MRLSSLVLVTLLCLIGAACDSDKKAPPAVPGSASRMPTAGRLPPGHPPVGGMAQGRPPLGGGGGPGAGPAMVDQDPLLERGKMPFSFTVPDGWKAVQPSTSMRIAQFEVPGPGGQVIECKVFGGIRGGAVRNITRWVEQFTNAEGGPIDGEASIVETESNGLRITTLDVSGVFLGMGGAGNGDSSVTSRMLAAEIEGLRLPIQVQLVGPADVVAASADRFHAYVASFAPTK